MNNKLKWIGIEEHVFEYGQERDHLDRLVQHLEEAGIQTVRFQDSVENRESEGLLILDLNNTYAAERIGRMPVIGYDPGSGSMRADDAVPTGIRYVVESFAGIGVDYVQMVYHRFYHLPLTIARTKRGILREITEEDLPALWEAGISIRNIYGTVGEHSSLQEEREFVQAYISNMYQFYQYGMWCFCLPMEGEEKADGRLQRERVLGIAGFAPVDAQGLPENSLTKRIVQERFCLQAGYHICYKLRGRGYGSEALQAILTYGWEYLEADAVILFIEEQNILSIKLAEKAGFEYGERTSYRGRQVEVYIRTANSKRE